MNRVQRRALERIYAEIPDPDCKGLCVGACGPIVMTVVEYEQMVEENDGQEPGECHPETLACPLLSEDGRCTVYHARPLICRLYGAVEDFRCEHGCQPDRLLTPTEAGRLMQRVAEIDPRLVTFLPDFPGGPE